MAIMRIRPPIPPQPTPTPTPPSPPVRPLPARASMPAVVAAPELGELLTPDSAADRLGVSPKLLERWRGNGYGPPFVRLTRKTLRYGAAAVEAFIAGKVCTGPAMQ